MNIAALLTEVDHRDRPALIFSNPTLTTITFQKLDDLSSRIANGLQQKGLKSGERVVILAPISLELYASLIAIFKLGATAVFLDPQTGFHQLDYAAKLADASALICSRKASWLKWLFPTISRIPLTLRTEGVGQNSIQYFGNHLTALKTTADVEPDFPALITFTGGSTDPGGARGVVRSHGLLANQHLALGKVLTAQPGDIDMPAFPVATLHNLASGITSVIPDFPFRRPEKVQGQKILEQIKQWGITTASGSPAYWWALAGYCSQHGVSLPLRRIVTGGAPVAPDLIKRLSQIAPQAEIVCVYGSTEAEPVASITGAEILAETAELTAHGAGIPLGCPASGVSVKVLDASNLLQGTGEIGEIWVAGEHVSNEYFNNPDANAYYNKQLYADRRVWHRMGDLGYWDEGGRLWLAGRVHTSILRNDVAYYPVLLEAAVGMLPFVYRAALTGVPDPNLGESTCLTVELVTDPAPPEDWKTQIKNLCTERGWILDQIRTIRHMPVDARHNARIDYKRLKSRR